uniref:Immunoglobulin domain-containing protein n=1 Tax=Cyprinus carpio TaxID=7962 RepID=A0A8C1LBX0_CYPCA
MFHRFWFCLCLWRLAGVFADSDAVKSVSVLEGDSVSLQTNTELQTDDQITWAFGPSAVFLAQLQKETRIVITHDPDGRFRNRLKVNNQTGSLTITNTRTTHSGLYQIITSSSRSRNTTYKFNVTVFGESQLQCHLCC